MPAGLARPDEREAPEGTSWAETAAGVKIPLPVTMTRAELSWLQAFGDIDYCPGGHPKMAGRAGCPSCRTELAELRRLGTPMTAA
jgi:hypothetical protein